MDYLRTEYKNRELKEPKKANPGKANGNYKHGGYCIQFLNDEERVRYNKHKQRYLDAYPYLTEPAMADLLHEC